MAARCVAILLAVALFATAASASNYNVEPGTIVATGTFAPVAPANTTTARGRSTLYVPLTGNATCYVNMTGSLDQVSMSHIHWLNAAAGNPILVGLMPRYHVKNGSDIMLLDPFFSYKGSFNFVATFPVPDRAQFLTYLRANQLFVNVHTAAQPGGAAMSILVCKKNCKK